MGRNVLGRYALGRDILRREHIGRTAKLASHGDAAVLDHVIAIFLRKASQHVFDIVARAGALRIDRRGAGVVGEEPVLKSGEAFEYTSGVPLQTPSGFMVGTYGMVSVSGEHFDIEVPAFSLDSVENRRTIN